MSNQTKQLPNQMETLEINETNMKKKFVSVQPVSSDAKDRFVNIMDSFHSCVVEQEENEMLFLASLNKCYYFTLPRGGNEHWKIVK